MNPRQFRLQLQQRLTENQTADAAEVARLEQAGEGDLTAANTLRLRMALRRFPLILLGGRDR